MSGWSAVFVQAHQLCAAPGRHGAAHRWRTLSSAAGAVCLLSGCSDAPDRPPTPTPSLRDYRQVHLPADAYEDDAAEVSRSQYAAAILVQRCMRRLGSDAPVAREGGQPGHTGMIGILSLDRARRYGYAPPPDPPAPPKDQEMAALMRTKEWTQLMMGNKPLVEGLPDYTPPTTPVRGPNGKLAPPDGCNGESARLLGMQGIKSGRLPLGDAAAEARAAAAADPRTAAAHKEWAACMKKAGYTFTTWESATQAGWQLPGGPSGAAAKKQAVADVRCKQSTNLLGKRVAILSDHQWKALDADPEGYRNLKAHRDEVSRRIAKVLGEQPAPTSTSTTR